MQPSRQIYPIERILSSASYLTAGFVGFIWLLLAAFLKKGISQFLRYHIYMSIFLTMAYFILTQLCELIYIILYRIPLINAIPYFINMPIPILLGLSIIQTITTAIILYLAITSFMGKYSYFPWASDIMNRAVNRK